MSACLDVPGSLSGARIRRARKEHRCDGWNVNRCGHVIRAGSFYVEGERNDEAGGYGTNRIARECLADGEREAFDAVVGATS